MKKVLLLNLIAMSTLLAACTVNNAFSHAQSSSETPSIESSSLEVISSEDISSSNESSSSSSSSSEEIKHEEENLPEDDYTILIYMCGSDLESNYADSNKGFAYKDLAEILKVKNQPEGVNIVIETGGAKKWSPNSGVTARKIERWHVENQQMVKDAQLSNANMGLSKTFQSFLEWGLETYPAKKTGVIMWDHGGGMEGVCYDETASVPNYLTPNEMSIALSTVWKNKKLTNKLEWIGYDACLMAVQDIADMNSNYFNYFVGSQETEAGDGWDYDNWLDNLYANPLIESEELLTEICRSFVADNSSEATLSALDLSKMSEYKAAWEDLAVSLEIDSATKWNTLVNVVKSCSQYALGYYGHGECELFDVGDFITKGKAKYPSLDEKFDTLSERFEELKITNKTTSDYKNKAHGLSYFCPAYGYYSKNLYSTGQTQFLEWRNICIQYGNWA